MNSGAGGVFETVRGILGTELTSIFGSEVSAAERPIARQSSTVRTSMGLWNKTLTY